MVHPDFQEDKAMMEKEVNLAYQVCLVDRAWMVLMVKLDKSYSGYLLMT